MEVGVLRPLPRSEIECAPGELKPSPWLLRLTRVIDARILFENICARFFYTTLLDQSSWRPE